MQGNGDIDGVSITVLAVSGRCVQLSPIIGVVYSDIVPRELIRAHYLRLCMYRRGDIAKHAWCVLVYYANNQYT